MIALSGLLPHLASEPSQRVVALTDGRERTVEELLAGVSSLRGALEQREEREWGVYLSDGFDFLITFLALLESGKHPVMLPNAQPDFLEQLALPAVCCKRTSTR